MPKHVLIILSVLTFLVLAQNATAQPYPPSNLEAEIVDYANVDLTWHCPVNPEYTELYYDDGSAEAWYWVGTATGAEYMATAFTYSQAFTLEQIAFYIRSSSLTTQNIQFKVFGDNGGVPNVFDVIATQTYNFVPTSSTAGAWVILDTPVTMSANDVFYLACKWNSNNDYAIGSDSNDPDGMGFWTNTSGSTWSNWTQHDFMMRAMITTTAGRTVELNPGTVSVVNGASSTAGTYALNSFIATPAQPNANLADDIIDHLLTRDFLGYNIYRDGTQINATLVNTESFHDDNLTDGTYSYYVTAVYDEGESDASNTVSVNIVDPGGYLPPVNLTAAVQNDVNVYLEWEAPEGAFPIMRWDSGVNEGNSIGLTNGGTFTIAVRFTPTELAPFDGMSLTSVEFFPSTSAGFTLKVWTGGSWSGTSGNSGTLALSQAITDYNVEEFNLISLTTPITIDASQELWIGYTVTHTAYNYPAGCDEGPAINYYGNLIYQSSWNSLYDLVSSLNYNWNLAGYASDARGEMIPLTYIVDDTQNDTGSLSIVDNNWIKYSNTTRDRFVTGYHVYRDSVMVGAVSDPNILNYLDERLGPDIYQYYVKAVWADNIESIPSNTVSVETTCNPPNLRIIISGAQVVLTWDEAPGADYYLVERKTTPEADGEWYQTTGTTYSITPETNKEFYRVKAVWE